MHQRNSKNCKYICREPLPLPLERKNADSAVNYEISPPQFILISSDEAKETNETVKIENYS